jgi:stearoyl-CoA desaturase (delta-9 desaturase)
MSSVAHSISAPAPTAAVLGRTLNSPGLKRAQRLHAQAVAGVIGLGLLVVAGLWWLRGRPSASDLGIFLVAFVLVGLGSSVGFHRHFTHRGFQVVNPVRIALGILGSMPMQGTLFFWVALHRRHHEFSDAANDPHSPHIREDGQPYKSRLGGIWHSYVGWTYTHHVPNAAYYCRDLMRVPELRWVNRWYFVWVVLGFVLPAAAGGLIQGTWLGALSGMVWGVSCASRYGTT